MTSPSFPDKAIHERLKNRTGRDFWRSLEELADSEAFRRFASSEFPALHVKGITLNRRALLKIMAASLALSGLSACKGEEDEEALPYVEAPEGVTVGVAKWYATAVTFAGYGQPVLGKTFAGRPVKLEGNPDHPASAGATDAFTQAALLGLYDPGRSQVPLHLGQPTNWDAFEVAMAAQASELDRLQGEGFRLLTCPLSSPTMLRQIDAMMKRWPKTRWHVCDPLPDTSRLSATRRVFGRSLLFRPAFDAAETIVSIDDDFLGPGPHQTANALSFANRRRLRQSGQGACRLLAAEPSPSVTGSVADVRLASSYASMERLLQAIAKQLGVEGVEDIELADKERRWAATAVRSLVASKPNALLLVGPQYGEATQALSLLINERLGGLGTTLRFGDPVIAEPPDGARSLEVLAEDMRAGKVSTLVIIGTDPAYMAPADLAFRDALQKVTLRVHAGLYVDESASFCHWHLPLQHDLESWGDVRLRDGTTCLMQPLVRPFYDIRSPQVVLENLMGRSATDRAVLQRTWQADWGDNFEERWRDALNRGFVAGSTVQPTSPAIVDRTVTPVQNSGDAGLVLGIRPDAGVWDGSLCENAWAQETPRPLTKITWGNVILISPQLAAKRSLKNCDEVRLTAGTRSIDGPVWIMPGQAGDAVTITLGYGRKLKDSIAAGLGYDAYKLRESTAIWHRADVRIEATGTTLQVATTQLHQAIDGFDFVRTVNISQLDPRSRSDHKDKSPSLYPDKPNSDPSWGMSIDLDLCIGCNACVTACQAENNIPVVGKDLVAEGRHMHWLRVDHYYEGDVAEPKSYFEPVPCMHCEQAPCEMGCPVNAAVHSVDGLNLQVYNRCIGTRTCSSYCPYKVRRFNWFDFTGNDPEQLKAMRNPDVTVRSRGVMEKCTYCVQRIAEARIVADKDGRPIRDGEIVTACQQACPTQAIVFGNVADTNSAVSRRKASSRDYALLEEAGTRPRTTYLARIEDETLKAEAPA
ncbi:TAT-variant-translocated molybdopterin oxidoreductase [Rhizobium sp. P40RR-XXII]|uniref:TAT-variant-translocated molybdopterin oxidoreductase n=1 Tax=Rhizobium sp. P40RR-XXII TaxID=2726739 RepID=UPI0014571D3C|nr:TAT-variant-translocated molybdopterin oxidoreductase [Rhizobium sp. P40RR-XXII]NLS17668.1 TAT-variant-translocated molybdopterin oxidoreductase [Rhizobium sp. P40RR-XXII]